MKRKAIATTLILTGALLCCGIAGCGEASTADDSPAQVVGHEGRFELMGAHGCYGCHGVNEDGETLLNGAPQMPDFHYSSDSPTSYDDLQLTACQSCHLTDI